MLMSPTLSAPSAPPEVNDPAPATARQVAALCWRLRRGQVQVLLVTSRDTGRWVLPKGWPMANMGPEAAAAREAWEEAGVEGKVSAQAIGAYSYDKILRNQAALPCAVGVFPLRVQNLKGNFPERKQRRRKWYSADEAARLVAESELRAMLERLSAEPELLAPGHAKKRAKLPE